MEVYFLALSYEVMKLVFCVTTLCYEVVYETCLERVSAVQLRSLDQMWRNDQTEGKCRTMNSEHTNKS